ncbi:MAG: hypothetical protein VYE22_39965 [Myxococcota bacterium]|nr:hypothetical protein [Myxococcota bacterium]
MTFRPEQVTVHVCDEDTVLARWENVLVQVRRGPMTEATLSQVASIVRSVNARYDGPSGALSIIEPEAPVSSLEMRRRQSQVIGDLMRDGRNHVAVVTPGEGVGASLARSVARLLIRGNKRIAVLATLDEAIGWLAPQLGRTDAELGALAEFARSLR